MNKRILFSSLLVLALIALSFYFYKSLHKSEIGVSDKQSVPLIVSAEKNDVKSAAKVEEKISVSDNKSVILKQQAETMVHALLDKDYEKFSQFTYPGLIELIGGKEKFIQVIEKGMSLVTISKVSIGEPSKILTVGTELQATIPETLEIRVEDSEPKGILVDKSTLIAVSKDGGKNWYFMDTSTNGLDKLRVQFPNLSPDLVVPPKQKPIFYKD